MKLLDILFPKFCVGCGKIGRYICATCKKTIIPIAPNECICPVCEKPAISGATHPRCQSRYALDGLSSFFYYKDTVRRAIHELKYRFVYDLCREFLDLVPLTSYEIRSVAGNQLAVIIPIALHPRKARTRGFNQSARLGAELARRLRIRVRDDILVRIKDTLPQAQFAHTDDRISNMKHAFDVSSGIAGRTSIKTVLLFDDVFTTGATMRAAGNVLKRSGFETVWGVTMAR